ncbi:MAG: NAD(P)/FAD-dependent oxidoreductase [Pseudomonadota bacterium]
MAQLSRRQFSALFGATAATSLVASPYVALGARPKVVVIGGGAGGGTVAKYVSKDSKGAIDVTLIEPSKQYYTCFFSNLYLGGLRDYKSIGHSYGELANKHGVGVIHDWAAGVDREAKTVALASGAKVPYDRLVVSPGIDLDYDSVPGYSAALSAKVPHAWKSGTQIQLLKAQVENMREGGTYVMVAPPNPYRCPPGPYERISMVAHVLKERNPKAKILILDPKPKFSKQALFMEGWESHYPGMVEWIPVEVSGPLENFNAETMEFTTEIDTFKADVANIIPAQRAGAIAQAAGLTNDKGWCPVVPATMQSTVDENVHIVGDSSIAAAMPKSGFAANSQAKVAAVAIRHALTDSRLFPARFANTCWSAIAPNDGVKVGARYTAGESKIEATDKFISKTGESAVERQTTYEESFGWYDGITADIFA